VSRPPGTTKRSTSRGLSIDERLLRGAARVVGSFPESMQRALSGGRIERDGCELDAELALILKLGGRGPSMTAPSLEQYRREQQKGARIAGGPKLAVGAVRDLVVDGAEGDLRARFYSPERNHGHGSPAPLIVFFHGGGFVFGDVDTHDAPCRYLCRHAGAHVLSVEYRLAPEYAFPAAALDARAALKWAFAHAVELGADPARVAVAGDSAGGNLAAVASWMSSRDGGPAPIGQVLVYPAIDRHQPWPSLEKFAEGFFLTRESILWFHEKYTGSHDAGPLDPRLNPLAASDLEGLPPTLLVTAGFDPLRDEGEGYAAALSKAGNAVTLRRFGHLVHGFFNMVGVSKASKAAVIEIAGAARVLLSARPS